MSKKELRLLLIDEKTYVARIEKESFKQKGVIAHVADNSTDATRILNKFPIDVVCVNVDFQKGAGLTILKYLKKSFAKKVSLWTVSSVDMNERKKTLSYLEDIDLCFVQPLSKEFFIKKIRKALNQPARNNNRVTAKNLGKASVMKGKSKTYLKCQIIDLSTTGMQISYLEELAIHHAYSFILSLDGINSPLHLKGKITRIHSKAKTTTLGVQFTQLSQENTDLLAAFLNSKNKLRDAASYYS